jgi:membrane peptidoglycan carboxypeptidase
LQDIAQVIVQQQVANLEANNAFNGALVAIRPASGEILAMVGSADFYDEMIDGQVNMATSPTRQPGSAIKPITYLAAFEKGWTPATLIWDVPSEFPPSGDPLDPSPPYKPVNYDGRFHGPVTVRSALANSYNVPAVKVLQFVGINDNPNTPEPDGMIAMARRLGISSLIRPDYGLSLTLGGGEVSLMELTRAYSVIANGGRFVHPVSILKILDFQGNIVFEAQPSQGDQVIRSEHAYLISSILSDNVARAPMFGPDSILNLPFTAAAKTGTTNDFRDNWTIGYTADVAVGVWVGNADYTPMLNTTGLTGAAPIWAEFMQAAVQALTGNNPTPFYKPSGIVDRVICAISGTEPSQWCSSQRSEYFAADQLPLSREQDLWARVSLDTWTGLRASAACLDFVKEEFVLNVTDAWAVQWVRDNSEGRAWAENNGFPSPVRFMPARECRADDPRPFLEITSPGRGQSITTSPLDINGRAGASADFRDYNLSYGVGTEPIEWKTLVENSQPINQNGRIYSWDLKDLPAGIYTLRLTLRSVRETSAELRWEINLQVPTSTPTQTPTVTITPTPTGTSTSTPTSTITATPTTTVTPSPTASPTPVVQLTPTPPDDGTGPNQANPPAP